MKGERKKISHELNTIIGHSHISPFTAWLFFSLLSNSWFHFSVQLSFLCLWHCYVADNGIPHSFQLICHEAYYTQSMCFSFNLKFMFLPVQKTTFNSHSGNLAFLNVQREGAVESRTSSLVLTVCCPKVWQ